MRQLATRITPNLGNHNRKIDWTMVRFSSVLWIFSVHRTEPANTTEKCPLKISWLCWSHKNWASSGSSGLGRERSSVSGYSPKWVSAQGQKPSQRPQHTDSTKGWLGWDSSNLWKQLTKIGVTMSKRWGFSLIVFVATGLATSEDGIGGSGKAVSD